MEEDIVFKIKCESETMTVWCEDLMRQLVVNLYEQAPRKQRMSNEYTIYIKRRHTPSKASYFSKLKPNEFIIFEHLNNKKALRLQLFQIADLCIKHLV